MAARLLDNTSVWVSACAGGAIACVELLGDVDGALAALGVAPVAAGRTALRHIPVGAALRDEAVVGRWTGDRATVMTHGGAAVVNGFLDACAAAGITGGADRGVGPFVEAADGIERAMLETLARAASPAAVDLLLDQPRRWRSAARRPPDGRDALLRRLIEPALVVAVGPPNIGKSSLLNALAGRSVSVVADESGTTRDHVGALIDLGGVVVRWVDTPGLGEEAKRPSSQFNVQTEAGGNPERTTQRAHVGNPETEDDSAIRAEAQRLALLVAARADVLVLCADATASIDPSPTAGVVVRIGLRDDLGPVAGGVGVVASASMTSGRGGSGGRGGKGGRGVDSIVRAVREAVVPEALLSDGRPWVFWGAGETRP